MAGHTNLALPHSKQQHHGQFLLGCAPPLEELPRASLSGTHKALPPPHHSQFSSAAHEALVPSHHRRFPSAAHKSLLPSLNPKFSCVSHKALLSSYNHEFSSSVHTSRVVPHHSSSGRFLTVCQSKESKEESLLSDGPLEPLRPGFSRLPHSSLSFIPVDDDPAAAPPPPGKVKIRTRRGRRSWKKPTSVQAMAGAVVGGLWAALAFKGTTLACEHLDSHPLARNLPMGLTNNVNQLLLTLVTCLGGFAVIMFGVSSFGLALLTLKLLTAPKTPLQ